MLKICDSFQKYWIMIMQKPPYLSGRIPLFKPFDCHIRVNKEVCCILPSTRRRAGNSITYLIFLIRRRLLASVKVLRLRCTSAEKSGKTTIILFPKECSPVSLLNHRIASLSLKLRNLMMKVRGGAPAGDGLPDMRQRKWGRTPLCRRCHRAIIPEMWGNLFPRPP